MGAGLARILTLYIVCVATEVDTFARSFDVVDIQAVITFDRLSLRQWLLYLELSIQPTWSCSNETWPILLLFPKPDTGPSTEQRERRRNPMRSDANALLSSISHPLPGALFVLML